MEKKTVAVFCGGRSYEHEVSIITGMQVFEHTDTEKYNRLFVVLDKDGIFRWYKGYEHEKDYREKKGVPVSFSRVGDEAVMTTQGALGGKQRVDAVYLAFHGGDGEGGPIQGMLDVLDVPYTSASQEGSVIAMNKKLLKQVLREVGVPVLPDVAIFRDDYEKDKQKEMARAKEVLEYPMIIKPVHLGSSIGIEMVHNDVELEKGLNTAMHADTEILVEQGMEDFTEYNVSVRDNKDELEFSEIEEPVRKEELLSFADKYEAGAKKSGGMESLDRKLPADISDELREKVLDYGARVYKACRLAGIARTDFMYTKDGNLYCIEPNSIPGSMAFYLWEASGVPFQDQVTQTIEQAFYRFEKRITVKDYETDIVEKFIDAKSGS